MPRKRGLLFLYGAIILFTLVVISYLINSYLRAPYYFNFFWVCELIILDIVFLGLGTYFMYKIDVLRQNKVIKRIQTFLENLVNAFFNPNTKKRKILTLLFIVCLFYGLAFSFVFIHECGHAFSALLMGGYTRRIELDFTLYGRTFISTISGDFTLFQSLCISLGGLLTELLVGILIISVLFTYYKQNRFGLFLSILIFIVSSIISLFFYAIFSPGDFFNISQLLNVPPFIIGLFFLPHLVISIYIGIKLIRSLHKTHLSLNVGFLHILLIGFVLFIGLYVGIFPLIHQGYAITIY